MSFRFGYDHFDVCSAGLRALQGRKELEKLVRQVKITRDSMHWGAAGAGTCPCGWCLPGEVLPQPGPLGVATPRKHLCLAAAS